MPDSKDLIVLDRDGVINEDCPDFIRSPEAWRPIPGSLEAIASLSSAGYRIAVVTNQSGVGRGLFTEAVLHAIHARMIAAIEQAGGLLQGIYYCPHRPEEECECRKPKVGLLRQIERDLGCSVRGAPFVGDRRGDLLAARSAGARPILVQTGHGTTTWAALRAEGESVEVYPDLAAFTRVLLTE